MIAQSAPEVQNQTNPRIVTTSARRLVMAEVAWIGIAFEASG
jgi:hypothetical protein